MATYKELDKELVQKHYSRKEVLQAIVENSQHKEVVGSFGGKGYAKRPDVIVYKDDIISQVKAGVTSFHASEELWDDPLRISTHLSKQELSQMRKGWDLILDIDCDEFEISKLAAHLIIQALYLYDVQSVSCKFSGNKGFHIAIPFEAFPKTVGDQETRLLFPQAPRAIALLLQTLIEKRLREDILEFYQKQTSFEKTALVEYIAQLFDFEVPADKQLNPFEIVEIDTILLTSRHLYRQVYSLNEKSGLVSLPINPKKVLQFDRTIADVKTQATSRFSFLNRDVQTDQAMRLLIDALDAQHKQIVKDSYLQQQEKERQQKRAQEQSELLEKIPEHCFPPQIQAMLQPLQDGKKRAVFILAYFLQSVGYSYDEIVVRLREWNEKHPQPLREQYLLGQVRYLKDRKLLPPNFDNSVYKDIVGDVSDTLSQKVKNPVAYAKARFMHYQESAHNSKKKRAQ
ncbi:MAG: hypothetical protein ACMXYF_02335 [Candidatus Woesearchaeota archaeon]